MYNTDQNTQVTELNESVSPTSGGFMKFYGLYWQKKFIFSKDEILPGLPEGWTGRGTRNVDRDTLWMNFWSQKGVYVLYDNDLVPVYTGQAGLTRGGKGSGNGRTLGQRLREHAYGKYRNGWEYFSWFGFLDCVQEKSLKGKIKTASFEKRRHVEWEFKPTINEGSEGELNDLLDSFEAILIEAFIPRFNSRGGNLKDAVYVDQFESVPRALQPSNPVMDE
jgi:hypothetical protein